MPDLTPSSAVPRAIPVDGPPTNRPGRTAPVTSRRTALAGLATLAAAGGTGAAAANPRGTAAPAVVRRAAQRLVHDDGFPGVLGALTSPGRRVQRFTAGVGDLSTGAPVPAGGRVRVGSTTKTFTALTVLQLVDEERVQLDAPVETYLPGLVRGQGIDGRAVSVRQLLQHTSGLPEYTTAFAAGGFFAVRDLYSEPRDLLDLALRQPAADAPGARWQYCNTNYLLAGLLIQKVTGRPYPEEVTRRVIDRLGLRDTSFPAPGERGIAGEHPRGYHADAPGAPQRDLTDLDPSWAWAAGGLVSTPGDLNRFFLALLGGRLLSPEQLRQMRTTVEAPGTWEGARYGLGLFSTPLSDGRLYWGHGGDIPGFETRGGATDDGYAVSVAVTALPAAVPEPEKAAAGVLTLVDTAFTASPHA
ncbi:D-alanyl-D-alanine carboxypeptidase [Kineococcus radiotolerans]|uniref:D-alanyl-D-alanine carboxypeptidase n=1 Tax=Kineococcus radiotolerans TaxID=131568 RepID=A0A7W4TJF8_KINRA|nr:serine hydrolase domain-containing protein [Kineococcus radiotolerans]MBB2899426.1 D-alanyl-D-alanine carboxypeptidase [Kineococcus radiotolerans]